MVPGQMFKGNSVSHGHVAAHHSPNIRTQPVQNFGACSAHVFFESANCRRQGTKPRNTLSPVLFLLASAPAYPYEEVFAGKSAVSASSQVPLTITSFSISHLHSPFSRI